MQRDTGGLLRKKGKQGGEAQQGARKVFHARKSPPCANTRQWTCSPRQDQSPTIQLHAHTLAARARRSLPTPPRATSRKIQQNWSRVPRPALAIKRAARRIHAVGCEWMARDVRLIRGGPHTCAPSAAPSSSGPTLLSFFGRIPSHIQCVFAGMDDQVTRHGRTRGRWRRGRVAADTRL